MRQNKDNCNFLWDFYRKKGKIQWARIRKRLFLSMGAYGGAFITLYVWKFLPGGRYKMLSGGLSVLLAVFGAVSAGMLNSEGRRKNGSFRFRFIRRKRPAADSAGRIYEELLQMLETEKRRLELEMEKH